MALQKCLQTEGNSSTPKFACVYVQQSMCVYANGLLWLCQQMIEGGYSTKKPVIIVLGTHHGSFAEVSFSSLFFQTAMAV